MSNHIRAELQTIDVPQKTLKNTAEVVKRCGMALTNFSERSMYPMLRYETDRILVVKSRGPFKKNDVLLYLDSNDEYLLQRVIRVKNGKYITRADNETKKEYGISGDMVVGVLKGFFRDEKYIDCDKSIGYKWYIFLWTRIIPLRYFLKK